jgi:amino acid transporter
VGSVWGAPLSVLTTDTPKLSDPSNRRRPLGPFVLAMLMFGITTTLHGLSPLATYGLGSLFYLLVAVVGFLIPAGLVAAELATGWPHEGGVYIWVSEAFGKDWGFVATWLQWQQNLIFWTVILTGSASMLAIGFGDAALAASKPYTVAVVVGTIWLTTWVTARGLHATGKIGILGSLVGTALPGGLLVALALYHVLRGEHSYLSLDWHTLLPDLSQPGNLSFGISTIMIFAGVELMGARANEVHRPEKNYPRASFLAIGLTVLLLVPATLSISVLVPDSELNIAAGLVQAVRAVFSDNAALPWLAGFFALALWLDATGEIAGWMAGTPISMARAGRDGFLPKRFSGRSGDIAPGMLYAQAVVGSLICLFFIVVPGVQSTFWLLSALLVQLYVGMYLLLFLAAWRLRKTHPDRPRPYRVPGGKLGMALSCGVGLAACVAVFVFGFFRPTSLTQISEAHYLLVLNVALALSVVCPLALIWRRRRQVA